MTRSAFASPLPPLFLATLVLLGPGVDSRAQEAPPAAETTDPVAPAPVEEPPQARVPYEVTVTGVEDDGLRDTLNAASALVDLKGDPPPSIIGLERRADTDRERLQAALRSAGYYDARLAITVDGTAQPATVAVAVTQGPRYHFKTITVEGVGGAALPMETGADGLGLTAGEPALAQAVVDAEGDLLVRLGRKGYAFARIADRRVVVDHADRSMDVTYTIESGPQVRYGATRIEGLERVEEALVRGRLGLAEGRVHDPAALDRARQDVAKLDVFDTVRVRLAEQPGPDGVTPVIVTVAERKRRFLGAGVSYSTQDGVGAQAYWGHRNLFGGAEQLRVGVDVGRVAGSSGGTSSSKTNNLPDLRFSVNLKKPDFLAVKQSLVVNFQVVSDQPPAYSRVATVLTGSLERPITDRLTVTYGLSGERGRVKTEGHSQQTAYVGVPLGAAWNGADDLLNPTKGERASLQVTPWFPAGGDTRSPFTAIQFNGSYYHDLTRNGRYVAAARLGVGSVLGASLSEISPDHRFYAGGGGSVRGYGFQKAGPRDRFDDPAGGRSLLELGAELRIKVTDSIGVVPFVDAGTVYDSAIPDFSQPLRVGAGLGARYYTDFGPLRVDVGIPLNAPSGDARWQLYLSLGQAF